jgi:hypothetical protein
VPGPGTSDRDENIGGVPVFAQLAGGLADAGFAVVRYDRRGIGQSGGRSESAGIGDAADDASAVVKFLEKRKDIDKERIVLVGHGEGAAAALLAVRRTGRVKAAVLVAGPGTTGADLVLERQQRAFEVAKIAESDRAAKVELQKKVNTAVLTGKGWNDVPEEMRRRAESPGFASLLAYDPASLVSKIDQPLLILHGGADAEFPPHHAEKLGALANARKKAPKTEVIVLPGVNHQLVSGEARTVAPEIVSKIAEWVKALPASD